MLKDAMQMFEAKMLKAHIQFQKEKKKIGVLYLQINIHWHVPSFSKISYRQISSHRKPLN